VACGTRDTKIEVIECQFPLCISLLCDKRACELNKSHIISIDEDPGLRIESFSVINLRGVSTNNSIICFNAMQTYKELVYDHYID
jgi:hypothetical protein